MQYSIELEELTKCFGTQTVLDGINFKVHQGKITTLLGFSGSGKSTLIKHILGLYKPTSGTVKVLEQDLEAMDEYNLREFRRNFGMLFQYAALFDSLTALENVAFPLREFTELNDEAIIAKSGELLQSVGLTEESYQKLPGMLSGGMRKRVGLARALSLSPKIMLYDEPTTGLDPITTHTVNQLIQKTAEQHKDQGLTSLIISHDIRATLKISDFVAFLERGKIVEYAPVEEFKQSQNQWVRRFLDLEL